MWLIIGLMTLSSPILITLLERFIREPEKVKKHHELIIINPLHSSDLDISLDEHKE